MLDGGRWDCGAVATQAFGWRPGVNAGEHYGADSGVGVGVYRKPDQGRSGRSKSIVGLSCASP